MALHKKPVRKWRDPATLATQKELEIISAFDLTLLQEGWKRPEVISFLRLALEVALKEAIGRVGQHANADHEYWDKTETLSASAEHALKALIEHIKPNGLKYYQDIDSYSRLRVRLLTKRPDGGTMNEARSKGELEVLQRTHEVIALIRATAANLRKIRKKRTGAEVEHDKHGFVFRLAEAWLYLTGRLPGLGKERNPFLRFVEAAAVDANVPSNGFYDGMKAAIQHLETLERFDEDRPSHEKNYQSISGIREFGPDWAKQWRLGRGPQVGAAKSQF